MSEPIKKQIGAQMKDGSIDNITGEKFGWWVIWRKLYKSRYLIININIYEEFFFKFNNKSCISYYAERNVIAAKLRVPALMKPMMPTMITSTMTMMRTLCTYPTQLKSNFYYILILYLYVYASKVRQHSV